MRGFLDLFRLTARRPMGLEEFLGALGVQTYSTTLRVIPLVNQQVGEGEIERYICRSEERHRVHAKLGKNSESTIARQKGNSGNTSSYYEPLVIFFGVPILVLFT